MTCTKCGNLVPKGARFCGDCGTRIAPASKARRIPLRLAVVLGCMALAVVGVYYYLPGGSSASAGGRQVNMPVQQQKFCKVLIDGYLMRSHLDKQIATEKNPFRQDSLQKEYSVITDRVFDDLFALVGTSGTFDGWRGTLSFDRPDKQGMMPVKMRFACPLDAYPEFKYMESELFHFVNLATGVSLAPGHNENTGISYSSPLGQTVVGFSEGQRVSASGAFVWAPGDIHTIAMTIYGKHHFHPSDIAFPVGLNGTPLGILVRFSSIAQAP